MKPLIRIDSKPDSFTHSDFYVIPNWDKLSTGSGPVDPYQSGKLMFWNSAEQVLQDTVPGKTDVILTLV